MKDQKGYEHHEPGPLLERFLISFISKAFVGGATVLLLEAAQWLLK